MKIKKGDNVLVISGKDRNKIGKVLRVLPDEARVVLENVNLRKKHSRPRKAGERGQIITFPAAMHVSNVMLVCPKCGKAARAGYRVEEARKIRVCKKCGSDL